MITKVIRLKLYPPYYNFEGGKKERNEQWKSFRKMVSDIAYQVSIVKNMMASRMGIFVLQKKEGIDCKEPRPNDVYKIALTELWKRHDTDNKNEKINAPIISAKIASDAAIQARDSLSKKNGIEFWRGNKSLPTFRRDGAVSFTFTKENQENGTRTSGSYKFVDKNIVRISLYSNESKKVDGVNTYYDFQIHKMKSGQNAILNRILSGEYEAGEAKLFAKNRDIYLNVCFKFNPKIEQKTTKDRIAGIFLGVNHPAICTSNSCGLFEWISDELSTEILRYKDWIQKLKTEVGARLRKPHERRKGHGRMNKIRAFERFSGNIRNFQKTMNQRIAKRCMDYVLKIGAECIAMEDLSGIYESGNVPAKWLRRWAYYELQQMIENKAKEYGIEVVYVNRFGMRNLCSKCKSIKKGVVKTKFFCSECHRKIHADLNESINISNLGYELFTRKRKDGGNDASQSPSGQSSTA